MLIEKGESARIERDAVADCAGEEESVTRTAKLALPAVVAMPVIAPVDAFKLRPVGRAPLVMLQLYGSFPPVASRTAEYGIPTVASGGV